MCCGKTFLGLNLLAFISIVFQWPEQAQIVCEGEGEGEGGGEGGGGGVLEALVELYLPP